jgi:hypothetical protein
MESGQVFFVLLMIAGMVSIIWRMNMAMNHPEKYERLKAFEQEWKERQTRPLKAGLSILSKFIKR